MLTQRIVGRLLSCAATFLLATPGVGAEKVIWTAEGSIDTNGDGIPDRYVRHRGVDTNDDGRAGRKDKTIRNDTNQDGDFDDAGETENTQEPITGNAQASIEMTDTDTGRKKR